MSHRLHLLAAAALIAASSAQAAGPAGVKALRNDGTVAQTARTAADYVNAKTLTPSVSRLTREVFDLNAAVEAASQWRPVVVPGGKGGADARHLGVTLEAPGSQGADDDVGTEAVGTGGLHFTSSRVSPKALDKTFPVRTVGKLYFKIGTVGYMCTGSMIKPGVVLTSGHCIHSGNGASTGYYNSFEFIPGYRKVGSTITMPYNSWTNWQWALTTSDWYFGGGGVPNTGDWAVIVFGTDGAGKRIGDYTGWLGYGTGLSIGRQNTILGYPGNLDAGGQLHRVDSMITNYGSLNTGTYGSDMQGGSSGGPYVLNWRVDYTDSSTLPSENWGNIATSTVSWGYTSTTPKVQGGSMFNTTFLNLVNSACTAIPSAC